MTSLEMQYSFEIRVNQEGKFNVDRFGSNKIQDLLNLAQEQVLQDKYDRLTGSARTKFEANEKVRRELSNLISSKSISNVNFSTSDGDLHNDAFFVVLPGDYLYGIEERCVIEESDGNTGVAMVMPITYDEYIENIDNPFLKPYEEMVWRLDYGLTGVTGAKKHEIIYSSDIDVQSYSVRYIRRPQEIVVHPTDFQDCELDKSLHNNIVNRAITMALGSQVQQKSSNNE